MGTVYILGAGASYGDVLRANEGPAGAGARLVAPPLVNGFFKETLFQRLGYTAQAASEDFKEAFEYVGFLKRPQGAPGTPAWDNFDLEEIFTSVELEREFRGSESDERARLTLIRNKLVRYIGRIIALCTQGAYGEHTRRLAGDLDVDDSVITFNWDLLLDREVHPRESQRWQYKNFFALALQDFRFGPVVAGSYGKQGMLLKLHGSFNWYQCTNRLCREAATLTFFETTSLALERLMGIGEVICQACGSEMNPLLIPPLLRKPIHNAPTIRSIWGIAKRRLKVADNVVVIGFSLPPTDFYANWLLRSVQASPHLQPRVFVVNPMNDPDHPEHGQFSRRMGSVFPAGYNSDFTTFAQIGDILERLKR